MAQRAGGPFRPVVLLSRRDPYDPSEIVRILDRHQALTILRGSKEYPVEMAALRRWARPLGFRAADSDDRFLAELAHAAVVGRGRIVQYSVYRNGLGATANVVTSSWSGSAQEAPGGTSGRPTRSPRPTTPSANLPPETPADDDPASDTPSGVPAPPPPDQNTWIEFVLIDETTGEPIAGVPFTIELTDGTVADHTTDGSGKIRIDGIDPGTCGIVEIRADDGPAVTSVE